MSLDRTRLSSSTVFLGVDQGSSSTKAALINSHGELLETFEQPVGQLRNDGTISEQDPVELERSIIELVHAAKRAAGNKISALGLSLQRSGVLAWEGADSKVLHPMITWADRRFAQTIQALEPHGALIQERCGIPLTLHYAAPKIAALQKQFPSARVGTLDSYLISKFSAGAFVSEHTMAARTMLYRLDRGEWDSKLCSIFEVDRQRLANICFSQRIHGQIEGIGLRACLGDQQAVLIARRAGGVDFSLNLGSIASLCWCTGEKPVRVNGMIASVLDSKRGQREFLLEGVSNCCGALMTKLHQLMPPPELERIVAATDPLHTTVIYYPLQGEGSPYWRSGVLSMVQKESMAGRDTIICALIENLVFFIAENFKLIDALRGVDGAPLAVSGGVSASQRVLEKLSQAIERDLVVDDFKHLGAVGAAIAACGAIGLDVVRPKLQTRMIASSKDPHLQRRFERWRALRAQAIGAESRSAPQFSWEMLDVA